MKNHIKRLFYTFFALTLLTGCMFLFTVDAQAAKTHTYKRDKANGVLYQSATRIDVGSPENAVLEVYLAKKGDYISSVKSSSPHLIAKLTYRAKAKGYDFQCYTYDEGKTGYKTLNYLEFYTVKKGKYTVTVTIKNSKNKVKTRKKITVYAGYPSYPIKYVSYAGKKYYTEADIDINTEKSSGKLKVKAADTYSIKKVEIATKYDESGNPLFKKATNGKKVSLAKKTNYNATHYFYSDSSGNTQHDYSSYDYLKPVTHVKVTYYDKKLKTTGYVYFYILYIK